MAFTKSFETFAETNSDLFIPWDKQHPGLVEGDIMPTDKKNAIINPGGLWPNKIIPYVIDSTYSRAYVQNCIIHVRILNICCF